MSQVSTRCRTSLTSWIPALPPAAFRCCTLQLVSSDVVHPFGVDSIRVCNNFMFVGMSREDEGIVKVYNLAAGGASHQLTGHKVSSRGCLQYDREP